MNTILVRLLTLLLTLSTMTCTYPLIPSQIEAKLSSQDEWVILYTNQTCKKCGDYKKMLLSLNSTTESVRLLKNKVPNLGTIDCEQFPDFCKEWGVKHFPSMEMFFKGERLKYTNFYVGKEVAKFIKDVRSKSIVNFNLKDFEKQVKQSTAEARPLTIFVGSKSSPLFQKYESLARTFLKDRFYVYEGQLKGLGKENDMLKRLVAEEYGNRPNILIVKNKSGNFYKLNESTTLKTVANYFASVKHPYLVTNQHELVKIYQEVTPLFLMITDSLRTDSSVIAEEFNLRAKEQKNNSNFALLDAQEMRSDFLQRFLDEVEVEGSGPELPVVIYFQPVFETLKYNKNLLPSPLSIPRLRGFIKSCIAGDLPPITRINSKIQYDGVPYLALNAKNWEKQLAKRGNDAAVLLIRENYRTDRDTKEFLRALESYKQDPTLDIYIFNIQKNDISVFVPDDQTAGLLLHLKANKPSQAQVFQKAGMAVGDVRQLIDKRNEFDKSKMGDMNFDDFDMSAIMKEMENIDLSGLMDGMDGEMDMSKMAEALGKLKGMGNAFEGMGGDFDIPGGMNDFDTDDL